MDMDPSNIQIQMGETDINDEPYVSNSVYSVYSIVF